MNDPFANRVRAAARVQLPPGAWLKRDRGDALFVTDAPRCAPGVDWSGRFQSSGFDCRIEGGLARLSPGAAWPEALSAEYPEPPDQLCKALQRFNGPPDAQALRLFSRGLKALDAGVPDPGYDRAVRRRAAECLRAGGGGGLYACAILQHLLGRETST